MALYEYILLMFSNTFLLHIYHCFLGVITGSNLNNLPDFQCGKDQNFTDLYLFVNFKIKP